MSKPPSGRPFQVVECHGRPLLLLRPMPDPDEGFAAYLTRLCSANRLHGSGSLARCLGLTYGQLLQLGPESFREVLCGRATVVPSPPGQGTATSGRVSFLSGVRTYTRLCPCCLREGARHDRRWGWPLTLACQRHGCLLIDKCPRCLKRVSHLRRNQCACDCGFDFRLFKTVPAPSWLPVFYRVFSPWRQAGLDEEQIIAGEARSLLILRALLLPENKQLDSRSRRVAGASKALFEGNQLDPLDRLMCDWPKHFHEHLIVLTMVGESSLHVLLKNMRKLRSPELNQASMLVRTAVAEVRREERRQRQLADDSIRSLTELAKLTRLSPDTLIKLIAVGQIRAVVRDTGRQKTYVIPSEEAIRLRQLYSSSLSLAQAAQHLVCSEIHVNLLARAGAISAIKIAGQARTWRFKKEALDQFLSRLWNMGSDEIPGTDSRSAIPLNQLSVKNRSGYPRPNWVRFAERIMAGDIPLFRLPGGKGLGSIAMRAEDLPGAKRA